MTVAVAAEGKNENSSVSEVSGRAPYYVVFAGEQMREVIKNPFRIGGGGAGFGVVEMLSEAKVDHVISGKFGTNMKQALTERGISYEKLSHLSVKEAVLRARR